LWRLGARYEVRMRLVFSAYVLVIVAGLAIAFVVGFAGR
jgi:hypothetical protein